MSNLPPGVTLSMIDPPEGPCKVCGLSSDHCICPECPVCQTFGDPRCYAAGPAGHGLIRSPEQIASRQAYEKQRAEEAAAENAYYDQLAQERGYDNHD